MAKGRADPLGQPLCGRSSLPTAPAGQADGALLPAGEKEPVADGCYIGKWDEGDEQNSVH